MGYTPINYSKLFKVLLCGFALTCVSACEESDTYNPVIVGVNAFMGNEPIYWAESQNVFPPDMVHLVETPEQLGLLQLFRGRTITAASVSLSRAISWEEQDVDATVVAVISASNGIDQIYADPAIKSVADLAGARVGVELGTVNEYLLRKALAIHNLDLSDVIIFNADNTNLPDLLMSGRVEAVVGFGSGFDVLKNDYSLIFSSADIPNDLLDILVVKTGYLKENSKQVEALIEGLVRMSSRFLALDKDAPVWPGVLNSVNRASDVTSVKFLSPEEQAGFFKNNGAKLKNLIQKRQDLLSGHPMDEPNHLIIDSGPMMRVLERLAQEN